MAIVAACCIFVLVQLDPKLLLRNTTITGGDTGAHVWFPEYLREHLLPWRVAGWSNDFYAGFPAGQFYFPFPAVLIVVLDLFLPYNIAFKLVTALGPLALPAGAYVFARGIRAPRPAAPLFAVAATAFLFLKDGGDSTMTFDLHIMGGTLASTFAGEYSFMIALALSLFFLGTLARALDRRGPMWLPAVLLALTVTSHLVVAIFAVFAGIVIWLIRGPVSNFTRAAAIGAVGVLLTAFWFVPLAVNLANTTDMRYEPIGNYLAWMFLSENWFLYPFALVAIGAGIYYRRRATLDLAAITVATGLVFYNWEGLRALLGKAPAWNLRLLPFWYLMLFLLAGLGLAELVRLVASGAAWVVRGSADRVPSAAPGAHDVDVDVDVAGTTSRAKRRRVTRRRGAAPADSRTRRASQLPTAARALATFRSRPRHHDPRSHGDDRGARARAADARLPPVLGPLQLHRLRGREHRRLHRQVVAGVPGLPRHRRLRSRRAGWRGRAATRSVPTARRSRSCSCRTGPTVGSSRWRVSTSRRRRRRPTTS